MKRLFYFLAILLLAFGISLAQNAPHNLSEFTRFEPQPAKGFAYPYYLYLTRAMRKAKDAKKQYALLVIPNNSGKSTDDFSVQEADVKRRINNDGRWFDRQEIAVLMPVFPRPGTDWKMYTHALDRDVMVTDTKEFSRFDLQLIGMIDDARERLKADGYRFDKRVLMFGFSASGVFTNRFTFLHPDRIKAAAIGSPGGWAIAPVNFWKDKELRYPIGTSDFETISGKKLNMKKLKKVPLFLFLGSTDSNDSVTFRDGYEKEDEDLIFTLFGKTLQERWTHTRNIYAANLPAATLKLYPNVGHELTDEMISDIIGFLTKHTEDS